MEEEDVEIEAERRRWLDDVHRRLDTLTHYEVLGVVRNAGPDTIKAAFYRVAAVAHPDRYFGKRIGSYKKKMEAILERATAAYEALLDPVRRAQYDATLPADRPDVASRTPIDAKTAAQREAAMQLLKRHLAEGKAKVERLVEEAKRARAAGDLAFAAEKLAEALKLAPDDATIRTAHDEAQRGAAAKLAESHKRRALVEERFGNWSAAATSWERVLAAHPGDDEARVRLAQALARAARGG